jgi:hypothetical protein
LIRRVQRRKKILSNSFIDLLVINTIIPLQFAYSKTRGESVSEDLISILDEISPEKNSIIEKFKSFGIKSVNAFDTQSLLQLKKEYCDVNGCLKCAVGMELLKNN